MDTVAELFDQVAGAHPDNPCICVPANPGRAYAAEGLTWSYREVRDRAAELRALYARAGYGHGHRIAILLENRPSFVVHWLALNRLGVSVVPVNPDYPPYEIHKLLHRSKAVLAVCLPHRAADVVAAAGMLDDPIPVCAAEWPDDLPAAMRPHLGTPPGRATEGGLLFTSGTTGQPKGSMIPNEAFLYNGERYARAGGVMEMAHGRERLYNPLPLYYANSFSISNIAMILKAGCMIFPDRFHPGTWWTELVETEATIIHYLGIIPPVLLQRAPVPEERRHRVRFGVGGGINSAQHHEWERRFGFPMIEVFGMSELGICAATNHEPRRVGSHSVGGPWEGIEFRVVGEDGADLPPGTTGELLVRRTGPDPRRGFFSGYLDDPQTTAEAWRDGWFHTGDLLRRDEEGVFYFVDRLKNMIRRSGQNIAAAEVEDALRDHPAIAQIACVAVPDPIRQEEVMACIVPVEGSARTQDAAEAIMGFALERLAYFKAPGWILFLDSLPMTYTQKLQKSRIFEDGENPFDRPGCIDLRHRKKRQGAATGPG